MRPHKNYGQMSCLERRAHLVFDKFRGTRMDTAYTSSVLGRECCDDGGPVTVQRREGLQVRLQQAWRSVNLPGVAGEPC